MRSTHSARSSVIDLDTTPLPRSETTYKMLLKPKYQIRAYLYTEETEEEILSILESLDLVLGVDLLATRIQFEVLTGLEPIVTFLLEKGEYLVIEGKTPMVLNAAEVERFYDIVETD